MAPRRLVSRFVSRFRLNAPRTLGELPLALALVLGGFALCWVPTQTSFSQDVRTGAVVGTVGVPSGSAAGANVVLRDADDAPAAAGQSRLGDAVGDGGRFRIAGVPPGRYVLRVTLVGYERAEQPVQVRRGDTTSVDVELRRDRARLGEVTVRGGGSLTQQSTEAAAEQVRQVPGGANLVSLQDRELRPIATVASALEDEPGVVVQEFFGGNDQPRISIRGAGLQSNPQSRGLLLMHNGFPLNFADGSFVTGLVEPRMARHAEVYRGGNALGPGGATLGGAIDFVAPTGRSADGPQLKLTGGSYRTASGHAQYGWAGANTDVFVMGTGHRHDGFRQTNDEGERLTGHANVGYRWDDNLETRVYGTVATLGFNIPGPLNKRQLDADPTAVSRGVTPPRSLGPNVPLDRPRRETELYRAATRTTWRTGASASGHEVSVRAGAAYQYVEDDFRFPVGTGVRSTRSHDVTLNLDARRAGAVLGGEGTSVLGVSATLGDMDRGYFANERGRTGRRFADNEMQASTVRAFARQRVQFGTRLAATASISGILARREIDEALSSTSQRARYVAPKDKYVSFASSPATLDETYRGLRPAVGLQYAAAPALDLFAGVTRSYEPPTFNTLLSPSGGNPKKGPGQFQPRVLDAQSGTTVEVGTRRTRGRLQWDVVAYRTWLKNELLTTAALFGGAGSTSNAPVRTIHQGLETHVDLRLLDGMLADGSGAPDQLALEATYNLNDFYFDTDARNQLAGVPRHRLHAQLTYDHPVGLSVTPDLTWMPQRTPTDHANTIYQSPYALLGARAHYTVGPGWLDAGQLAVFVEAENLTGTTYASSYLVRDQVPNPPPAPLTSADVTSFIPGQGRTLQIGVTVGW